MVLGIINLAVGVINLAFAIKREREGREAPLNWIASFLGIVCGMSLILINLFP